MYEKPVDSSELHFNLTRRSDGKITVISNFLDELSRLTKTKRDSQYEYFFRGHSNKDYTLAPALFRSTNFLNNEDKMIREMFLKCPNEFQHINSTFQKLVKMQHYGLPTRLLDLSSNPLIALYFACGGSDEQDGEVIIFKVPKEKIKYYDSFEVSVFSALCKTDRSFTLKSSPKEQLLQNIDEIGRQERQISNFDLNNLSDTLFVKALYDNERILKQEGCFLLFGMGEKITDTIESNEYEPRGIIVHNESKKELRESLRVIGIHEGTLFPEIGNISQVIKKQFQ